MESLSARLRQYAAPVWEAQLRHPVVLGIGDGTLPVEKFAFWVRQDYLFLIDYSRLFGYAVARAPDLATMTTFADLLSATLKTEMDLHRSYCAEFGITPEDLERETKAPTTQAYTDFLLRVAATADFPHLVAALLPCLWGFAEIGQTLKRRGLPPEPRYARWIEMYASEEFARLAEWCRQLLDRIGGDLPARIQQQLAEIFLTSSRYELAFWDMADRLERWPV